MRALVFTAAESVEVTDVAPPEPRPKEALLKPLYVGLCGTDLELFRGEMPYFAQGRACFPLRPGHEVTATVLEAGAGGPAAGTPVVIDPVFGCGRCSACASGVATRCPDRLELGVRSGLPGGACDLISVPVANLHAIPDGVSTRDAVLVEPGVTALNAVARLGEIEDRDALVIGAGTVGLLAAQLLRGRRAAVDVVTVERRRTALVERLGLTAVSTATPDRYQAVIEAAGQPAAVHMALTAVAPGGTIALTGVQSTAIDEVDVDRLVLKDASMVGVLNGPGLYDVLLGELADCVVDAGALIEAEYPLERAQQALRTLSAPDREAPKVLLRIGPT